MFKKSLKITVILTFILLAFAACEQQTVKEDVKPAVSEEKLGRFSKQVTVFDDEGKNSVTLSFYCDDKEILSQYDESSFELIPIHNGLIPAEIRDLGNGTTGPLPSINEESSKNVFTMHIVIEEETLEDDVTGFLFKDVSKPQYGSVSQCVEDYGWKQKTYYVYKYNKTSAYIFSSGYKVRGTLHSKWGWYDATWDYEDYDEVCETLCGGQSKDLDSDEDYRLRLKAVDYLCNYGTTYWGFN